MQFFFRNIIDEEVTINLNSYKFYPLSLLKMNMPGLLSLIGAGILFIATPVYNANDGLISLIAEAQAEESKKPACEADEIQCFKDGRFDELIDYYSQKIEEHGITLPEKTEHYCKRSVAKALKANKEHDNVNKLVHEAFNDLLSTNRGMDPSPSFSGRENAYRDFAAYIILTTVQLACDRSPEYKVPKNIQWMIECYVRNPIKESLEESNKDREGDFLKDFVYQTPIILANLYHDDFIGDFFSVWNEIPGLKQKVNISTERIMR